MRNCYNQLNISNLCHIKQEYNENLIEKKIHKLEQGPRTLVKVSVRELHESKLPSLHTLNQNSQYSFANTFNRNPC